ncbi:acyl CoA:acetate/3-ketoacid CoA transferase [Candidatus Nitrosocosmicus agrestis]|uniref:acyl CoA:acetate/3-ketoacid CoA transferase n=1 Tax=Candidatus Nitrosocosmicus agrestis TaxID=2563600 RepID=UPI001916FC8E|nr:CoA-transferase [Candidatus Nitrosocosmicus sp. SS]
MSNRVTDASTLHNIADNSVIAISGFNMATTPEYLINELLKVYQRTGHPKNIFIMSDALPAVPGRALDKVGQTLCENSNQDFIRGMLMPFLGFSPWLQRLVLEDRIEAYGWPIGITAYWFREIGSGRPGLLTKIGINTFLDPRNDTAALNQSGKKNLTCKVELVQLDGEDYLFYKAPKPDWAFIRASIADEMGNMSLREETIRGTVLSIAQATKACPRRGKVICQVRWLGKSGTLNPREVDIPFPLVDHIIISPLDFHWQTGSVAYDPRLSQQVMTSFYSYPDSNMNPSPHEDYEIIIAKRVVLDFADLVKKRNGSPILINLGIGIPALVSKVIANEGLTDLVISAIESGPWGGFALTGNDFGTSVSPFAMSTIPDMFSNFEGGIVDAASLGFLEIDEMGNVNPSILPGRIFGAGGFPVIAGGISKIYFAGSFTGGKKTIRIKDEVIKIVSDGSITKFVKNVHKISFSGKEATKYGQEICYITERAVFKLSENGLLLTEVAPGVDIQKDVINKMEFKPRISANIAKMDSRIFNNTVMNIKTEISIN